MSNNVWLWRIVRSIFFVLAGCFLIFLTLIPYNFLEPTIWFSNLLFVLVAAMISRRPGSANLLTIFIIATYYTLYTDEGIALGGFSLIVMSIILRKIRNLYIHSGFIIEWIAVSITYIGVVLVKNLILVLTFSYSNTLNDLIQLAFSFIIIYPIFNFIIKISFRSKQEGYEEAV